MLRLLGKVVHVLVGVVCSCAKIAMVVHTGYCGWVSEVGISLGDSVAFVARGAKIKGIASSVPPRIRSPPSVPSSSGMSRSLIVKSSLFKVCKAFIV